MECVALAGSDKEGEGEIKEKTKKYKERTYSKDVLNFQKDSQNTFRKHSDFCCCSLQNSPAVRLTRGFHKHQMIHHNKAVKYSNLQTRKTERDVNCSSATDFNELVQFTPTKNLSKLAYSS